MVTQSPYVFVTRRDRVKIPVSYQEDGIRTAEELGVHGIWAARVPFIPALDAEELSRLGAGRIGKIVGRQFRFLYDLARAQHDLATYELRFIARPASTLGQPGEVEIVFLGKTFHRRQTELVPAALRLWEKFASNYPLEDPFNYPLQPVTDSGVFQRLYEPIGFTGLDERDSIVEIRRYEEIPIVGPWSRDLPREGDYIVHPFVPTLDFSAMGRFFEALAIQPQPCFASISLRPIVLFDGEVILVNEMAARFRTIATDGTLAVSEYMRSRARMGAEIYQTLMQEREFLMQVKVQVVGLPRAPYGLVEALGSELMNNGQNPFPTKWIQATPSNAEQQSIAKTNLMFLEHYDWGERVSHPALGRLRTVVDVKQAAGAFRLPIPPESGYMPGVLVKNEPFVSPQDYLESGTEITAFPNQGRSLTLGEIYHRGNPTGQEFAVPVDSLIRHGLIAGSTGSGKSTTILSLLAQLWQKDPRIPFLVLYPIDKPDYRQLLSVPALREDLLVFTLGAPDVAPFQFNPFAVPEGVSIRTHLSRLMRAFNAAFELWDPLPMIFREALRRMYRAKEWKDIDETGKAGRSYPVISDFKTAIEEVTEELEYSKEVLDNVKQASVIRIADLIENVGGMFATDQVPSFAQILERPVVMELGRIGSQEDVALVMGFLLIALTETLEKTPRRIPHITVVEEAHRLMATGRLGGEHADTRSSAGEDFSNILSEIRGFNAGLLIAEQIPHQLVTGAIGNTYLKIMHWLEDATSFELFADIMNLSEQQRSYARRLKAGEAIVRNRFGRPVHIKVPQILAIAEDGRRSFDDEWLARVMPARARRAGLFTDSVAMPPTAQVFGDANLVSVVNRVFNAPLDKAVCSFCRPLWQSGNCLHGNWMRSYMKTEQGIQMITRAYKVIEAYPVLEPDTVKVLSRQLCKQTGHEAELESSIGYCLFAHTALSILSHPEGFDDNVQQGAKAVLRTFPWQEATS